MGQFDDIVGLALIGGIAYYVYTKGIFEQVVNTVTGGGGGGGSSGGGGGAGDVTGTMIYKGTGKTMNGKKEGPKTRNYASGKASDTTTEWNVESCPFDAYEFTAKVTIKKIDHDDTVSMKMYGPHHSDGKGAWYINDITFNSGDFEGGYEQPHPDTSSGCEKGGSIGKIVGKTIALKSVIWPLSGGGAHVEMYADASGAGTNWKQLFAKDNPCGKKFKKDGSQQVQLRIDAAPGCEASSTVAEIEPGVKAGGSGAATKLVRISKPPLALY